MFPSCAEGGDDKRLGSRRDSTVVHKRVRGVRGDAHVVGEQVEIHLAQFAGTLVAQRSLQGCGPIESVDSSASRATDRAHPEADRKLSEEGWPRHFV